jgi:penicillin-binding protein 2
LTPSSDRKRWKAKEPRRERDKGKVSPASFAILRALVILMFGALALQLINMQILKGDEYKDRAAINALREVPLAPARGLIYDRNMQPLVQNSASFSVAIVPGDLPERGEGEVFATIERVLGVPAAEIEQRVQEGVERQGEYNPTVIQGDIGRDAALELMELEPHAPGLKVVVEPSREYTTGSLLSHVLGYVGPLSAEEYDSLEGYLFQDFIGKSGVELTHEDVLRGQLGKKLVEVDGNGREIKTLDERRPLDGGNVVLSIDAELQAKVAEALQQYAGASQNAAAAVMDVRTGEVLAMVSLPTFDNNIFSSQISQDGLAQLVDAPGKPLVNHALSEQYAPGSTFKAIVAAAALQEGIATPETKITSRGYITVQNEFDPNVVYIYPDWRALGPLDMYGGLAMSSNVYFYYLAGGKSDENFPGLGEDRLARYAHAFGLGEPTGIDLPGESEGVVPDASWKQETVGEPWALGDTYNLGIGQGYIGATPMQVLTAICAIANGGKLLTPHVVKEVRDGHGSILSSNEPEIRSTVPVDPAHLGIVREGMRRSVMDGVAKSATVNGISIAGKTGTAEFGPELADGKHATHGWFVGFAPYENPEVAVVVFTQQGTGGNDASPAAAKIFDFYFHGPRLAAQPAGVAP